jgi:protein tyrosine/serine phosphatase
MAGVKSYIGRFDGNVRVVEAGRVYRSAQLTGPRLREVITTHHIRSVLNLRGAIPTDAALREERAVCRELRVEHADIDLAPDRWPGPAEARELLHALDTLPRPLLLHCSAGSDRSGLAATLYLAACRGVPLDQAQSSQLTWRYGHWPVGRARAMDGFLDLYRQTGRGRSLRVWVLDAYPRVYAERGSEH